MTDNTQLIDQYVSNELPEAAKLAFEQRLQWDTELKKEFDIQKQITEAARTAGITSAFNKTIKQHFLMKQLLRWGLIAGTALIGTLFFLNWHKWFGEHEDPESNQKPKTAEQFILNTATDTIIETKDGVVFAIPAHAFKSSAEKINIEIETALTPADIMKLGLSTTSNGQLLQTAGMFSINGVVNGDTLPLQKEIQVSVPAKEINPKMQVFDGVKDATGNINWVNPKTVERKLRTYDITTLDFYPPDYIPTLKALGKNYTNKKYTDSLYYSFSGWPGYLKNTSTMPAADTTQTIEQSVPENNLPQQNPLPKGPNAGFGNLHDTTPPNIAADTFLKLPGTLPEGATIDQVNSIIKDSGGAYMGFDYVTHYEINPAKIKAIWNKKFNNTLLATKEFEERLKFLHGLCTDTYLNAYIQNLNKPLYVIDEMNAQNSNSDIKKEFLEFAKHKDGIVAIASGLQQKLNDYFQNKYKAYQEASIKTWNSYQNKLKELDKIADEKKRKAETDELMRNANNFHKEYCSNLTDAYAQIGVKRSCGDTAVPWQWKYYYNVTITTPGWKNLDIYVFEATATRESMVYTDPATGKKATVTYKECSIEITNRQNFDNLLVYLIPGGLNSFQRMNETGSTFKENLNMLFTYDAIAIGYKGTQAYYFKQTALKPQHYIFTLSAVDEKTLNGTLNSYQGKKKNDLFEDFTFQLFQQQEAARQVQVRKDAEFRQVVARSIFKCYEGNIEQARTAPAPAPQTGTNTK